ncbi:hypothetical protein B0H10DRAFT_1828410, partial [Mycena sp. CBHHK59/15]
ILLVVHPKYKTAYFAKAKWPREWIKTAEDLVRYEWETHYKPQTKKKTAEPNVRCQLLIPSEPYTVHTLTAAQKSAQPSQLHDPWLLFDFGSIPSEELCFAPKRGTSSCSAYTLILN